MFILNLLLVLRDIFNRVSPLCGPGKHQDQHIQLGEDPQVEFQTQTLPHQAT